MGNTVARMFGMKTSIPAVATGPTAAQTAAAEAQARVLDAQEQQIGDQAASARAARRARGAGGRALLLNDEIGIPPVPNLQKTLGA
jgi:hypothetical protein